ncbi:MAG: peptide ABC transporter permease [Spirochaetes bacterium GWB1_66_5]|nr:MAG: peptide ABC transporter permease [Spirochaetes bacterium GWB1_66_5]
MSSQLAQSKGEATAAHPGWRELAFSLRRLFKNPLTIIGLTIILFFVFLAVFAPLLAPPPRPEDPFQMPHKGWKMDPSPPSAENPLGTLPSQYDILYGVIWGTRNAFRIGIAVVAANLLVGLILGALAGYFGGLVDEIIMRIADIFYAIPLLVMAMALVVALGRGLKAVVLVLIILNWPTYTRVIRAEILVTRNMDFILAARASGASHLRILFRHVLPNSIFSAIIVASMNVGVTVLIAAALSFLGLGSDTGIADWGAMVSQCRNFIVGPPENRLAYWYLVFIPGFVIALFVLGWNLLGDAVRDVFDPRMRRR